MQKVFNKFMTFGLSITLLFGVAAVGFPAAEPYAALDASAAESTYTGTYYNAITATSGDELLGEVHDLIVSTHKTYTSYDDCKNMNYIKKTDPSLDGEGILEFYTHETMTTGFGSSAGILNREHVWPKSLGNWETSNAGADLHHIRPTETRLNGDRGNKKYGEVTGGTPQYSRTTSGAQSELGGYANSSTFMPLDNVKGDVARIVMYVYTHYNTASNVHGTVDSRGSGALTFTRIMAANNEDAAEDLLLKWNEMDPVDDIELTRNEEVYKIQGNRNPFIDHPEYAEAIWGDGTLGDPVTPTSISLSPATATIQAGKTQVLTVSAQPSNATKSVTWKSDNDGVATVSNGTVTGRGEGVAHITATSTLDPNVKAEATITVTPGDVFTPLTEAREGTFYLGMEVSGTYYFSTDALTENTYYIKSTTEVSEAAQYTITQQGSGWVIKQGTRFLEMTFNGTHANPIFSASQTSGKTWAWDPTNKVFTWTDGTDTAFLGNYNEHTDIGGAFIKYIDSDYHAVFGTYTVGGGQGGEHTHTYSYEQLDGTYHTKTCTGCEEVNEREAHVYTDDNDMTCNLCGYDRTNSQGGGEQGDSAQLAAFKSAVAGIVTDGSLTERFNSINAALTAYRALTDAEKAAAQAEVKTLQSAIEVYDRIVAACNAEADDANAGALGGAGGLLKN